MKGAPGAAVAEPPCDPSPVEGDGGVAVHAEASSLDPDTAYVYRVVAESIGGTGTATPDEEFTTLAESPVASFSVSPAAPVATQSVTFDGSASSDPGGSITSYRWDFGDGSRGAGQTSSHTYSNAGIYTVTLKVSDDAGAEEEVAHSIEVVDAPQPDSIRDGQSSNPADQPISKTEGQNASSAGSNLSSYAFSVRRVRARCDGRIVFVLRVPRSGSLAVRATLLPRSRIGRRVVRFRGSRPRPCLVARRSGRRPAGDRLIALGASRDLARGTQRVRFGHGSARSGSAGLVKLIIRPRRAAVWWIRRRPHRRLLVRMVIYFAPDGGGTARRRMTILLLPRVRHPVRRRRG